MTDCFGHPSFHTENSPLIATYFVNKEESGDYIWHIIEQAIYIVTIYWHMLQQKVQNLI